MTIKRQRPGIYPVRLGFSFSRTEIFSCETRWCTGSVLEAAGGKLRVAQGLPRVMTSNKARHASGPVLLPSKRGCSARAYHRGSTPSPSPTQRLARIAGIVPNGPHPRPPFAKIEGIIPIPIRDRSAGDGGSSPSPVPIGDSAPCLRHKEQASFQVSLLSLGLTQRRAKSNILNLQTRSTHTGKP